MKKVALLLALFALLVTAPAFAGAGTGKVGMGAGTGKVGMGRPSDTGG